MSRYEDKKNKKLPAYIVKYASKSSRFDKRKSDREEKKA